MIGTLIACVVWFLLVRELYKGWPQFRAFVAGIVRRPT